MNILCNPIDQKIFEDILYTETTTLGIRKIELTRSCLRKEKIMLKTKYGEISVKKAFHNGKKKYAPEYEDCQKLSEKHNLPLLEIYNEVIKNI